MAGHSGNFLRLRSKQKTDCFSGSWFRNFTDSQKSKASVEKPSRSLENRFHRNHLRPLTRVKRQRLKICQTRHRKISDKSGFRNRKRKIKIKQRQPQPY